MDLKNVVQTMPLDLKVGDNVLNIGKVRDIDVRFGSVIVGFYEYNNLYGTNTIEFNLFCTLLIYRSNQKEVKDDERI